MSKFINARTEIKALIEQIPALSGVSVFVERGGDEFSEQLFDALRAKGLVVVVMSAAAATTSQTSGGRVSLNTVVPLAVLENPSVNFGTGGASIPGEIAVENLIGLAGHYVSAGELRVATEVFGRSEEEDGLIVHTVVLEVPMVIKRL